MDEKNSVLNNRYILMAGIIGGLLIALWGLIEPSTPEKPSLQDGTIARVNNTDISDTRFKRVLADLERGISGTVDTDLKKRTLKRLIEEELLLQKALELDLIRKNRRLRNMLTQTLIESVTSPSPGNPSDTKLRSFYDKNTEYFSQSPGYLVRQIIISKSDHENAPQIAKKAVSKLRSNVASASEIKKQYHDENIGAPVPKTVLPGKKLRTYIGPKALRHVEQTSTGQFTDPIEFQDGYRILQVLRKTSGNQRSFKNLKPAILREYKRRNSEQQLQKYLKQLKKSATIQKAESLP